MIFLRKPVPTFRDHALLVSPFRAPAPERLPAPGGRRDIFRIFDATAHVAAGAGLALFERLEAAEPRAALGALYEAPRTDLTGKAWLRIDR